MKLKGRSYSLSAKTRTPLRGGRASALVSVLTLLACEENYITEKYYVLPEAGAPASSSDAGNTSSDTSSDTSSEPSGADASTTAPDVDASSDTDTTPDTDSNSETSEPEDAGGGPDASVTPPSEDDAGDAGFVDPHAGDPFYAGAPRANTDVEALDVDVFGTLGNRYWFATDPAQVQQMNIGQGQGEIYEPRAVTGKPHVESLFVTTPAGATADFGNLEVRLVGGSTYRSWSAVTIPNLRLDMDHFVEGLRLDGYEHLRLNNGLVGSIFREKLTLDFHRMLGYPAAHAQYAWVGSNVWGDTWLPYTMVQVYKKSFCAEYADEWGGGCENMWEFWGDFPDGPLDDSASCQSDECDNTRANEFAQVVLDTPWDDGFKAALEGWLDWDAFHQFQCLSWILSVTDDSIHVNNNVVLVERSDGLFQYLPYSTDISLGQDWFSNAPLAGQSTLAQGCQYDSSCWADTIATCEQLIGAFSDLNPVGVLNARYAELEDAGMLRDGDAARYEELSTWLEQRVEGLPAELESYRDDPFACAPGQINCDGYCSYPQDCWLCQGAGPIGGPLVLPVPGDVAPLEGDAGATLADGGPIEEPPVDPGLPDFCYPEEPLQ